jgi:hypothetical protein
VNSSRTWKSGEVCQVTGTYRCQGCYAAGRVVIGQFDAGKILPMCESCPEKDATWRLLRPAPAAATGAKTGTGR